MIQAWDLGKPFDMKHRNHPFVTIVVPTYTAKTC
jgi:hypothetical protein